MPSVSNKRDYLKVDKIMESLNCTKTETRGRYHSEDLDQTFDLSAINFDKILLFIANKMQSIGYEKCKRDFRTFLRLWD